MHTKDFNHKSKTEHMEEKKKSYEGTEANFTDYMTQQFI